MNKKVLISVAIIFVAGLIINLSKAFATEEVNLFLSGIILYALVPYFAIAILSFIFRITWLTILAGVIVICAEIYMHMSVFVFPCDAQAALIFLFSPIYLTFITIICFSVCGIPTTIIKNRGKKIKDIIISFPLKELILPFSVSLLLLLVCLFGGSFLMNSGWLLEHKLHKGIAMNDIEVIKQELAKGVDIEILGHTGMEPLIAASGINNPEIINLLVNNGAQIDKLNKKLDMTPLLWACYMGQAENVKTLLKAGADIEKSNQRKQSPLFVAADQGRNPEIVKILLNARANINTTNDRGENPLIISIIRTNEDITNLLISNNANLEIKDNSGYTALMWAVYYSQYNIVEKLLQAGADVQVKSNNGKTAIDLAESNNDKQLLKILKQYQEKTSSPQ